MSEIKPALMAEEWVSVDGEDVDWDTVLAIQIGGTPRGRSRHSVAALALHGQPFGFTWEDVDALLTEASVLSDDEDADPHTYRAAGRLSDIADRIAALLPPR